MRAPAAAAVLLLLAGCAPPESEGTAVGNPTLTTFEVATSREFVVHEALAELAALRLQACDRAITEVVVGRLLDLETEAIETPAGTWCAVVLDFAGPLVVEASWGDGEDGADLRLELEVGSLGFARAGGGAIVADEAVPWRMRLAGEDWLDARELGIGPDDDLLIDAAAAQHEALVLRVEQDSTLWSEEEGELLALADIGEPTFDEPGGLAGLDSEGCSCASTGGGGGGAGLLLALAMLGLRRRRRFG